MLLVNGRGIPIGNPRDFFLNSQLFDSYIILIVIFEVFSVKESRHFVSMSPCVVIRKIISIRLLFDESLHGWIEFLSLSFHLACFHNLRQVRIQSLSVNGVVFILRHSLGRVFEVTPLNHALVYLLFLVLILLRVFEVIQLEVSRVLSHNFWIQKSIWWVWRKYSYRVVVRIYQGSLVDQWGYWFTLHRFLNRTFDINLIFQIL